MSPPCQPLLRVQRQLAWRPAGRLQQPAWGSVLQHLVPLGCWRVEGSCSCHVWEMLAVPAALVERPLQLPAAPVPAAEAPPLPQLLLQRGPLQRHPLMRLRCLLGPWSRQSGVQLGHCSWGALTWCHLHTATATDQQQDFDHNKQHTCVMAHADENPCVLNSSSHACACAPLLLAARHPACQPAGVHAPGHPASPRAAALQPTDAAPSGPLTLVSRAVPGVGPEMLQEPATDMAGVSFTAAAAPALAMVGVLLGSVRRDTHRSMRRTAHVVSRQEGTATNALEQACVSSLKGVGSGITSAASGTGTRHARAPCCRRCCCLM